MNTEIISVLLNNPRAITSLIAEALPAAIIAYALVWLVMRPKSGKINNPFIWHSIGVAVIVIGSAIFRIIAMASFAGHSAYAPSSGGGDAGFYGFFMLILPAILAFGVIGLIKKKALQK